MKYISSTRRFIPFLARKKKKQTKNYTDLPPRCQIRSRPVIGPDHRSGEFGKIKYFRHPTDALRVFRWSSPPPARASPSGARVHKNRPETQDVLPGHRQRVRRRFRGCVIANSATRALPARHDRQTTFTPFVAVTRIGDGASPRASRARVVETTGRNTHDDLPSRFDAQPPPPRPARRLPRAPPRSASPPP